MGWHRRGRYFEYKVPVPGDDRIIIFKVPLADLLSRCGVAQDDITAALEDAKLEPTVDRVDTASQPALDALRLEAIPSNLTGKSVLDIGGWDGEMAAECLKRGAREAICFDSGQWFDYGWIRPIAKPGVIYQRGDLMEFGHHPPKAADVVLFYNVLYHVRDPWLALERCRLLTRETFVICTSFVPGDEASWRLFGIEEEFEQKAINDRLTVFWRPTLNGLIKMLKIVGFTDIEMLDPVGDHVCFRCH